MCLLIDRACQKCKIKINKNRKTFTRLFVIVKNLTLNQHFTKKKKEIEPSTSIFILFVQTVIYLYLEWKTFWISRQMLVVAAINYHSCLFSNKIFSFTLSLRVAVVFILQTTNFVFVIVYPRFFYLLEMFTEYFCRAFLYEKVEYLF